MCLSIARVGYYIFVILIVTQQAVCGMMGGFLLASVTWWSPGITYQCPRKRISTTDIRWAVNAE